MAVDKLHMSPLSVDVHLQDVLAKAGWMVKTRAPLRVQSHCAGADAPCFALNALRVPYVLEAASESDPGVALFHLQHHNVGHLMSDVNLGE